MPIVWDLRKWLAVNHDIYRPSELQAALVERVGVRLSLQAISALLKKEPQGLRIQTIQAICDTFNCRLSDFCDVLPNPARAQQYRQRKVGAKGTLSRLNRSEEDTQGEGNIFPNPHRFKSTTKE